MANESLIIYSMNKVGRLVPSSNKLILRDISLGFYYGAKIGVLGLNGAGKSTLLRIIAGVDDQYIGEISASKGYSIGMLEQEPKLDETGTVISVVKEAVRPIVEMLARFDEVNAKFAEPDADFDALVAEQAKLQEQLDKHDAWNLDSHLEVAMDALRCPPSETPIKILSGGERRRVALTRLLLSEPDILLLDEPTAGMAAEQVPELIALIQEIQKSGNKTVMLVEHNMNVVMSLSDRISVMHQGQLLAEGTPAEIAADPAVQRAYLGDLYGDRA